MQDDERERERAEDLREREELDENLMQAGDRFRTAHEEIERLQHKLHDVEIKYSNVLSLQDEAVKFTLQCLADMRDRPGAISGMGAARFSDLTDDDRDGSHTFTLQSLDPTRREDVMSYILEQLRAYQEQLKELELHSAWRQHTASAHEIAAYSGATPPVSLPRIPQNAAASSNGMWGGPPAGPTPALGDVLPPGIDIGAAEGATVLAVNAPLRPWGKRYATTTTCVAVQSASPVYLCYLTCACLLSVRVTSGARRASRSSRLVMWHRRDTCADEASWAIAAEVLHQTISRYPLYHIQVCTDEG